MFHNTLISAFFFLLVLSARANPLAYPEPEPEPEADCEGGGVDSSDSMQYNQQPQVMSTSDTKAPASDSKSNSNSQPDSNSHSSDSNSQSSGTSQKPTSDTQAPASGSAPATSEQHQGKATFYGGNLEGGTCSFKGYTLPAGISGSALSGASWDSSAHCGACASVQGPKGKVTVMFVDQCPECPHDSVDLFPDAFKAIGDPSAGRIDVTWTYVDCAVNGGITILNKEGSSQYYTSMQVQNGKEGTKSLEISTDGGSTWKQTQREQYNYFTLSGGAGKPSVDVKLTSVSGKVIIVKGVSTSDGRHPSDTNY